MDAVSPKGFDPLPTQKVPVLCYIEIYIISDGPSKFSKGPSAPVYTNRGWSAHQKSVIFFINIFQKLSKNAF